MNIGIVLPNWIGDVAMATPALRALRGHFGEETHLIGVMRPYVAEVLAGTRWLDETIACDTKLRPRALQLWRLGKQLKSRRLDKKRLRSDSTTSGRTPIA
jgi:heptosyltransferase-2